MRPGAFVPIRALSRFRPHPLHRTACPMTDAPFRHIVRRVLQGMEVVLTVTGFASLVGGFLALVWPGQARDVFDAFLERFALIEEDVAAVRVSVEGIEAATGRIEADTGQLVAALPRGMTLGEVHFARGCPAQGDPSKAFLMVGNDSNAWAREVSVRVFAADGRPILSVPPQDVPPAGAIQRDWQVEEMPALVCLSALDDRNVRKAEGIRVAGWTLIGESCAQKGRFASHEYWTPALSPMDPAGVAAACP